MKYQVTAEKPSQNPGEKIILRIEFPTYSEAWLSMTKLSNEGWRVTETPQAIEFPTFPLDLGSAA